MTSYQQASQIVEPIIRVKPEPFNLKTFIYNGKDGTVMGRNGVSWAKIGIFYIIFYGVLAVLVAICMWVFLRTLDPDTPKWTLDASLIGTNPGLGFRPLAEEENIESTLIWYKNTDESTYKHWTNSLTDFLQVYTTSKTAEEDKNAYDCDYNHPPPPGKVCRVNMRAFAPCTEENNFSYKNSSPCVFLKLNKIYGWEPEFYNSTKELPVDMPDNLKTYIAHIEKTQIEKMKTIWVSCEGENVPDQEHIGPVSFVPFRGFPGYYYPYLNIEGYLSPLVAVQFQQPVHGSVINIECKAWAKNIVHDRKDRIGLVHFELLLD